MCPSAVSHIVEHRPKDCSILRVVSLGYEWPSQMPTQSPKGQNQSRPVLMVQLHREASARQHCMKLPLQMHALSDMYLQHMLGICSQEACPSANLLHLRHDM